jgi:hypothetical protein
VAGFHGFVSMTEMPHFRRLVRFVEDVDTYARAELDMGLQAIVDELREDLRNMR